MQCSAVAGQGLWNAAQAQVMPTRLEDQERQFCLVCILYTQTLLTSQSWGAGHL